MKQNAAGEEGDDERPWADLRYKDWKSAAIRMLQERTFVVVGGIHIQEVIIQPRIANLDCSTLTGGQIDISQLKDGVVNCSVTGSGLGLATEISLEKGNIKIVGKIKAAVDGNSAVLQFKPDDMCAAEGIYSLYLTYKPNSEGDPTRLDSGKSASLGKQASISGAKLAEGTLTITGKCLDQLTDVALTPVGTETPVKGADLSVKSSTEATAKFSNLADKISYFLSYSIKAQQNQPIEAKTVVVTFQQPSGDQNGTPSGTRKTVDPTNTTKTSKATGAKNSKKPR